MVESKLPVLSIVVPCYNEEDVLPETTKRLIEVLEDMIQDELIDFSSVILYVDDGSRDRTWELIEKFNRESRYITGLKLARNAGHQNALLSGLMKAKKNCDIAVSIDADLQDDLAAIRAMVETYHEGYEVVYGVRKSRTTDTFFKRFTAEGFYKLMQGLGANIVFNHADFRLMSKRALQNLARFDESNLFLRGIVPMIGFRSTEVYYDRAERFAGESKYPLKKMLAFAFDGITSLSVTPIRFVTVIGFVMFVLSIFAGFWALFAKIAGVTVSGWASIMVSLWLIGGVQIMCLGLIGEYIGKIYKETKRRPKYILDIDLDPLGDATYVSGQTHEHEEERVTI
ncbi:glycosyltransferase family 2 protein [Tumebacillus permanentifrigoris]|uniref:Glycosyltransferase involved in cell wall biosynthesis n=1 Tax=Tumebacillus permanentifrigoris TaxID=378543 RepID=A0A316D446_9BACL|nr:glycosyltransferase family 2 protein [Tumebacillus permanentifrigoris]PWK07003.1 glycosyltransferase involved in cell wall biosynthesis [Tumebacillus permanentifrigoris]